MKEVFVYVPRLDKNIVLSKREKDEYWWNLEHQIKWTDIIVEAYKELPLKRDKSGIVTQF